MGWQIALAGLAGLVLLMVYGGWRKQINGLECVVWILLSGNSILAIPIGLIIQIWQ